MIRFITGDSDCAMKSHDLQRGLGVILLPHRHSNILIHEENQLYLYIELLSSASEMT